MAEYGTGREEDAKLCRLAKAGEQQSLDRLIEKHIPLVHSIAGRFSDSVLDTEDLLQEGMIGLVLAARAYDEGRGAAFSTFAYHCITNRMINAVAAASKNPREVAADESAVADTELFSSDPQEIIAMRFRAQSWLARMADVLSSLEREVFGLYLSGYGAKEIAERLSVSVKSVDNALWRAKRKMRSK